MNCLKILHKNDEYYRIFMEDDAQKLAFQIGGYQVPRWLANSYFQHFEEITEDELKKTFGWTDDDGMLTEVAKERFQAVNEFLPYMDDIVNRTAIMQDIAQRHSMSPESLKRHVKVYLNHLTVESLCSEYERRERKLTPTEVNMKWGLEHFYLTQRRNSLRTAYELLLQAKYTNADGTLVESYPTYDAFVYFHKKMYDTQQERIARYGLKEYQRNGRPLLGAGVSAKYPNIGVAMIDSTVCDFYIKHDDGITAARPYMLAAVDACSGLCMGFVLSWTSNSNDVCNLMDAVIADKQTLCERHGIMIDKNDWPCHGFLPSVLMTDNGNEYCGRRVEGFIRAGITTQTLPAYRPDLKSRVERFYQTIQNIIRPHMIGKGAVVETTPQHGQPNFEHEACLTMDEFTTIVLKAIVFFNRDNAMEAFPFTKEMMEAKIRPTPSGIWQWKWEHNECTMLKVHEHWNIFKLPTTEGKFTRKGLIVNSIRYRYNLTSSDDKRYTNRYLSNSTVVVAYDPNNVSTVWLVEEDCTPFCLIDETFNKMTLTEVGELLSARSKYTASNRSHVLEQKIALNRSIADIAIGKENKTK